MKKKEPDTKQTTVRIEKELLRLARYYLDIEKKSVQQFVVEQLERYVQEQKKPTLRRLKRVIPPLEA